MDWLRKRLGEGSTWAGLAVAGAGLGEALKVEELAPVAGVLSEAAAFAGGGNPWAASLMAVGGIAAIFLRDKGRR